MKALISGFALLTFLAASALPLESYAQTSTGGATTVASDTGITATSTTKKESSIKSGNEEEVLAAARLGLFEIVLAGIAAIGGDLPRRHAANRDLALEHRQAVLSSTGLPPSTTTSRIKPLWPVAKLSLCP